MSNTESKPELIYRIRTHSGYESFACVYHNKNTGELVIQEETPDNKVLGVYARSDVNAEIKKAVENHADLISGVSEFLKYFRGESSYQPHQIERLAEELLKASN